MDFSQYNKKQLNEITEVNNENISDSENMNLVEISKKEIIPEPIKDIKDNSKMIKSYADIAQQKVVDEFKESKVDAEEGVKKLIHIATAGNAMDETKEANQKFLKKIISDKQEEIERSFETAKKKEEARLLGAKAAKAGFFYKCFRPILEFDFSPLIKFGRPKSKPVENDDKPITYDDRAYGIILMVIMLLLAIIPYCIVSAILFICNGLNAIVLSIAGFAKPALWICGGVGIITILSVLAVCIIQLIQLFFGVSIFQIS